MVHGVWGFYVQTEFLSWKSTSAGRTVPPWYQGCNYQRRLCGVIKGSVDVLLEGEGRLLSL